MKKLLRTRNLPLFTLIFAILGLLLRLWTLGSGPDEGGLYAPQTPAWVLLWLVAAMEAAVTVLLTRPLNHPGRFQQNFPASVPGAAGNGLAALAMVISGIQMLTAGGALNIITGLLGLIAAGSMAAVALSRYQGSRPSFLLHAAVCLFFALRIFLKCRLWSNEPQVGTFLMPFLASVCAMLAAYQLAAFDVDMGNRQHSLFWSLMSVFFCAAAVPASDEPLFYILLGIWLMTNLCSLRHFKPKSPAPAADET